MKSSTYEREREILFIIVLFVTLLQAFIYEKLGKGYGSLGVGWQKF